MCTLLTTWFFDFSLSLPSDFLLNFLFLILNPDHHKKPQGSFSSSHAFPSIMPLFSHQFPCSNWSFRLSLFFAIKALPSPQSTTHSSLRKKTQQTKTTPIPPVSLLTHQNQHKSNSPLENMAILPFQHSFQNIPIPHKRNVWLQTRIWSWKFPAK